MIKVPLPLTSFAKTTALDTMAPARQLANPLIIYF